MINGLHLPDTTKASREANLRMLKEAMMDSNPHDVIALSLVYFDRHPDVDPDELNEFSNLLGRQAHELAKAQS